MLQGGGARESCRQRCRTAARVGQDRGPRAARLQTAPTASRRRPWIYYRAALAERTMHIDVYDGSAEAF